MVSSANSLLGNSIKASIQSYCKFPDCGCDIGRLGCAYEPYDMRQPHNEELPCPFEETKGG